MGDEDDEMFGEGKETRIKLINVGAKDKLKFALYYSPPNIDDYEFELPIIVKGYGSYKGITRMVKCIGGEQ